MTSSGSPRLLAGSFSEKSFFSEKLLRSVQSSPHSKNGFLTLQGIIGQKGEKIHNVSCRKK
jgi:hypothetical protein